MQEFLADMQTFSIEEAAALIANKYGWHEGAQKTLLKQLLDAATDGTLIMRHPHTHLPYRPEECRYYKNVRVSDLNRYFEAAGAPWRLDNGDETADRLWWNLPQALIRIFLGDRFGKGGVVRRGPGPAMRLIEEVTKRPRPRYPSLDLAQEALIEALQTRK